MATKTFQNIRKKDILKIQGGQVLQMQDSIAVESPLEIGIHVPQANPPILHKNIAITMRTPGDDIDLALGFLFTEGIIANKEQVEKTTLSEHRLTVCLNTSVPIDLSKAERHSYTSSSCGVCGKTSLASLKTNSALAQKKSDFKIGKELIKTFPNLVIEQQRNFQSTGGLHAAGLFDLKGNLMALREDVGRHNALDKLIGTCFTSGHLPLNEHLLFLSGRASFELLQKAAMAGIPMVVAVGAPSSLAIETAVEFDITLVGFLNNERYNIYNGAERISIY